MARWQGLTGMADVFVSYARSDKARVAPLVAAIEAKGWSVWWDPEINPGQEFDDLIDAQIDAAKAVLVVWTATSVASRWVRGEAREAADRGILVPVRFEQARLPMDVRAIHTTDLDGWGEDHASPQAQECLRALEAMIARTQVSQSAKAASTSAAPSSDKPSPRFSICVLPFANMSGDPEQEYFSDGITEDIITDLSKVSALAVTSSNTAFRYKGQHADIPKIARELRVSHVLEGSVRKAGGRIRINAQLIDAANDNHVWAERYDRDSSDIFALQDEISQAIVKALRLRLLPEEKQAIVKRGTDNTDAYNLYLMARQAYITGQEADAKISEAIIRLSARATEIDPHYAQAWALMAAGHMRLRWMQLRGSEEGMAAADRALRLNPKLAEAHAIKAQLLLQDGDAEKAAAEVAIALELAPESYEVNRS
ncbi:MAG: TIR domain-containing protein, partial [Gammaproteobacteria bacterium]